jgi:putative membrane-bound dehydrogenase-like protein
VAITPPQANDAGVRMELIASAPAIVTPIGIAVDAKERVLVLESHTHKPEKGYAGPKFDRVKALVDADGDGRFETNRIVADGIVQGMNLALGTNGDLFVCARTNVTKFTDGDGDGVFEQRTELLSLETSETYPHDCLLSVAVSVDGWLYVGRGNTGGQRWAMRARDGSTLRNFGDGGNVVRLRLDGSKFEEFATGFWNPFGLAFDAAGQLFCADNDPDSRGPNRIVHLVRGGDYGYRAQHGKSGLHPFQAWNGELPGTLPFVCGVGESPGTLVSCDFAPGLAKGVSLLVAIWGEERIDRVVLEPRGVSFVGRVEPLVRGDENFRPVALAAGPDGSVFVTDWGSRDYSNHGGGKLWRIKPARADGKKFAASPITNSQSLRTSAAAKAMNDLGNTDPFVRAVAIAALGRPEQRDELVKVLPSLKGVAKANAVVALRSASKVLDFRSQTTDVRRLLADPDEEVRFLAMKWAGEKGFTELAADVDAAAVRKPGSVRLSRAALEADQLLARANPSHPDHGKSGMTLKSTLPTEVLERVVFDESAAAEFRAQALVMLPAESARKHTDKLSAWAGKAGSPMQSAAIWSLGFAGGHDAAKILEAVIARENLDAESRADAVIARAMAAVHDVAFAGHWTNAGPTALRHAARFVSGKSREGEVATRPAATAGWQQAVATGGDARRGRRMFFSPQMGCAKCHVAEGRGAIVGPDLSAVGRSTSRARLIESIVEPSREVAIDFQGYEIETKSGETFTGLQAKPKPDGEVSMLGFDGRKIAVEAKDIASFRMLKTSLMPDGLVEVMSVEDFRDLLAYLEGLK